MKVKFQIHTLPTAKNSRRGERGVALIIALLCMIVISILAAAIIFSTQTELRTSANYRYTTQARYVAEAGAQQTIKWIAQNWTPPANFTNPSQYNLNTFPVLYVGGSNAQKIVFAGGSGLGTIADSYSSIDNTLDTNFRNSLVNVSSPFSSINGNASFNVAAQLLSATQVTVAGGSQWLTKWKIISQGTVGPGFNSGNGLAKVQVVEIMADVPTNQTTTTTVPNFSYAVLATGTGCNVIQMTGGSNPTNAYNSTASGNVNNSNPALLGTGGSVASFGNVYIHNGAHINGTVFSPSYNAGNAGTNGISCPAWTSACGSTSTGWNTGQACSAPSKVWSVNEDNSGSAVGCTNGSSCTQSVQNMPASMSSPSALPTPTMPTVTPNTSACTALPGGLCSGGSGGGGGCSATMAPSPSGTSYGQVNFGSCAVITLQPGVYNFDTLLISNGAVINVPNNQSVVINIMNSSASSTPFTSNGGTVINGGRDPNNLTFVYAGTNTINLNNGSAMFATIYAPNAPVTVSGNGGLFGAVVGKTFNFSGSGHVVYDTHLAGAPPHVYYGGTTVVNTPHLDEFSWSAY
jgi:hypothetical protein